MSNYPKYIIVAILIAIIGFLFSGLFDVGIFSVDPNVTKWLGIALLVIGGGGASLPLLLPALRDLTNRTWGADFPAAIAIIILLVLDVVELWRDGDLMFLSLVILGLVLFTRLLTHNYASYLIEAPDFSTSNAVSLFPWMNNSGLYSLIALILALLGFGFTLYDTQEWQGGMAYAVSILLIANPRLLLASASAVMLAINVQFFKSNLLINKNNILKLLVKNKNIAFGNMAGLVEFTYDTDNNKAYSIQCQQAAILAQHGTHPLHLALSTAFSDQQQIMFEQLQSHEGYNLSCLYRNQEWRIGSAEFCGADRLGLTIDTDRLCLWFTTPDQPPIPIYFKQALKSGAKAMVDDLHKNGYRLSLIKGEEKPTALALAEQLGIRIEEEAPKQPSLIIAFTPQTSLMTADMIVPKGQGLWVPTIVKLLNASRQAIIQNMIILLLYHALLLPLIFMGHLSPLISIAIMTSIFILIMLNGLRLFRPLTSLNSHLTEKTL